MLCNFRHFYYALNTDFAGYRGIAWYAYGGNGSTPSDGYNSVTISFAKGAIPTNVDKTYSFVMFNAPGGSDYRPTDPLGSLACTSGSLSFTTAGSSTAENIAFQVDYIDWDASKGELVNATCDEYEVMTSSTTTLEAGKTYVVNKDVEITSRITVNGTDANPTGIILCDDAALTASKGISVTSGKALTIYGQTEGTGTLTASGYDSYSGIGGDYTSGDESIRVAGTITINGGNVIALGGDNAAGIGGGGNVGKPGRGGNVIINGGNVTATGGEAGAGIGGSYMGSGGTVTINGGNVTATGGYAASGIGAGAEGRAGGAAIINGGSVTASGGGEDAAGIGDVPDCTTKGTLSISASLSVKAGSSSSALSDVSISDFEADHSAPYVSIYLDSLWSKLQKAFNAQNSSCDEITVYTDSNITVIDLHSDIVCADQSEGPLAVPENKTVVLRLNGNKLDRAVGDTPIDDGYVIKVGNGATFRVDNGKILNTPALITGGNNTGNGGGIYNDGGTVTISYYAALDGNNAAGNGGGVYNDGGICAVHEGGIIQNNTASNGGGIYNTNGGTAGVIAASTVTGNSAVSGGGIYNDNGYFEVSSSKIENCTAVSGGAIYNSGTLKITGTTISACSVSEDGNGGGVYVEQGTVTLGSTAKITDNKSGTGADATDNNLYLSSGTTVTLATGASGVSVGVTLAGSKGRFMTNATSAQADYFTSDNTACAVKFNNNGTEADASDDYLEMVSAYPVYNCMPETDKDQNGGYLTLDRESAALGETVTVTVCPNDGYQLKKLVYFDNEEHDITSEKAFTMQVAVSVGVSVNAEFEEIPNAKFNIVYESADDEIVVCFTGADGGMLTLEAEEGDIVTFQACTEDSAYTIDTITAATADGQNVDLVTMATYDNVCYRFEMPASDVTVTAAVKQESIPASSGGSSSSTVSVPVSGEENSVNVKATVSGNTATVKPISEEEIEKVIGSDVNTGMVDIDLSDVGKTITGVKLPTETAEAIAEAAAETENDTAGLKLELSSGTLEFDAKALETITEAAGDAAEIEIHFDEVGTKRLNNAQKDAVSEMDVIKGFEAYITVNGQRVSDFNGGTVAVYIPYEVPEGKDPVAYTVWFVAEDGSLEEMNSTYDGENHRFVVSHFSDYVLTYDESAAFASCPKDDTCPISKFSDADASAWYHDGVHYCLEEGIMVGFPGDVFKPDGATTRGQIAAILYNLEGKPAFMNDNIFTDVASGSWYEMPIVWAQGKGIVSGYGDGTFRPNEPISREELAVILWNYAQYKGIDVSVDENTNFLSFNDFWDTSEWAKPAMMWAIENELIVGNNWDLKPQGDAVRAQAATIIWKFCENIVK